MSFYLSLFSYSKIKKAQPNTETNKYRIAMNKSFYKH